MKKVIIKFAGLLSILLISANVISQTNGELKSKIEKLNKEMGEAMMSGNIEKNLTYYTNDAISMPNEGEMLQGKEAIRKSNEEMMKSGSKVTSFETNTLQLMGSDKLITEIGKYKLTFTQPGKKEPIMDHGKYITIWEKQPDGSLKIKVEMWNTDVNYMAMEKEQKK